MNSQPTLRRQMIISLAGMVLGSLVIGGAAIIAVNGLHQDLGVAVQGYRQLRQVFDVGFLVSKAREAMSENPPQPQRAISALQSAMSTLDERSSSNSVEGPPPQWVNESARNSCRDLMSKSIDQLSSGSTGAASLNQVFRQLSVIADQVRQTIADAQIAADHKRRATLLSILSLVCGVNLGAVLIGVWHYRRVIGPIQLIADGVKSFSAGQLDRRLQMKGDLEFVALADDFDQMAEQLSALYRDLESKVAAKSRELVRSQQLAGVGYLAAGVAHEINNPLGIIAGYAERAMQQLSAELTDSSLPQAHAALSIICEEAFRCKQITDRLLSLARPASEDRHVISLAAITQSIVATLSGLGTVKDRKLTLTFEPDTDLNILANEGEIKQLLLNLVMNAIEAVDPAKGRIDVKIVREKDDIELSVVDNGQGMTTETLDKIFQPFYSEKRGQRPGTGLGLSIAQSIVIEHGGTIEAHSDGPNLGSCFTVTLPAVPAGKNST